MDTAVKVQQNLRILAPGSVKSMIFRLFYSGLAYFMQQLILLVKSLIERKSSLQREAEKGAGGLAAFIILMRLFLSLLLSRCDCMLIFLKDLVHRLKAASFCCRPWRQCVLVSDLVVNICKNCVKLFADLISCTCYRFACMASKM